MMFYAVAIRQVDGVFLAIVPDLPTIEIVGESMVQVIGNVRLAIIEYLQNLVSNNQPIPAGQDIGVHLEDEQFLGHTWAIISLDSLRLSQHLVTVDLSLPKSLLLSIYHELGLLISGELLGNDQNYLHDELVNQFILDAIKIRLSNKR